MKCYMRTAVAITVLAALLVGAKSPAAEATGSTAKADAPLANASFEEPAGERPAHWEPYTWNGEGAFEYAEVGHTGKRSVMIAAEKAADVAWHTKVPVEPFSTYRLSGWIKTENVKPHGGRGALFNLHNVQGVATTAVTGTCDWTRVDVTFETGDRDTLWINCLLGGWGPATGKAWFDDLQLERLSMSNLKPTITIDFGRKGEPISKYVYGQFIEHLGRCIYGGIWAEMLEDRKFYFPITAEYNPYRATRNVPEDAPLAVVGASPWEILGPAHSVAMVKEGSFVGEHTPRIAPGAGIAQHDLALRKDKEYVGYVWLKPAEGKTTVRVSLSWGDRPEDRQTDSIAVAGDQYVKSPLHFRAVADTEHASLRIEVVERGPCFVGTASLMPADNVDGMRADTLRLLRELDSPIYRWPGGNFVSGYDWKDGIGPRDRRPPRKNPAWTGVEHNDFGLDEFLTFCRLIDTEPLIVVNSGLGGVENAVEEIQYANGKPDTPMGKLRAENGHAEPYSVEWWGVGNEMYGGWQLGHMPLEKYIAKHNQFAEAMRAADPSIKLVAVGAVGKWSEGMMSQCADHMDLISEHFYVRDLPGLMSHVAQPARRVREIAAAHRKYRQEFDSLEGKDIRIALDEWNYWYGPHFYGELGTRYFLRDALGVGAALNEFARNSDIYFMANYAQTVNVIGAIKTTKADAAMAATGLALALYRKHFGEVPVAVEAGRPLDVVASLAKDGHTLPVAVVNPTMAEYDVPLEVQGAKLAGTGRAWRIAGPDPMAYNAPGAKPNVTIEELPLSGIRDNLNVAPCSLTIFVLDVQ